MHIWSSLSLEGVGVVSWSPLACGIITGKYENGVPETSRASMKVIVPQGQHLQDRVKVFFTEKPFQSLTTLHPEGSDHRAFNLSSYPPVISVAEGKDPERGWEEAAGQAEGAGSHCREAELHPAPASSG